MLTVLGFRLLKVGLGEKGIKLRLTNLLGHLVLLEVVKQWRLVGWTVKF